ncbi:MAG: 5'-nucleotidase C-terminal domain-containing protein [Pseudomonadota bacterium]
MTQAAKTSGTLRVIATSDLHMNLTGFDYIAEVSQPGQGLAALASTISNLRADPDVATELCDNGDLIQGNPLADELAANPRAAAHPMITAMQTLGYDVMTIGNHDFDYGLEFLQKTVAPADFPVVSANIFDATGQTFAPYVMITRTLRCSDGVTRDIRIGLTGFAPPQVAGWTQGHRQPLGAEDIVVSAQNVIPQMQAAGADIIVALCHSGMSGVANEHGMENAAIPLSAVPGIDALVMGHTHDAFPDGDVPNMAIVDGANGLIHGTPAVNPGAFGHAVGVIDLHVTHTDDSWQVTGHKIWRAKAKMIAVDPLQDQINAIAAPFHAATLKSLATPVAQSAFHIQNYFARVHPDICQQILSDAMIDAVRKALGHTADDIRILAATSPFTSTHGNGSGKFVDLPTGSITRRHTAAVYPFADRLCAVRRTGAQIRAWLEQAACHYARITPGVQDQPLFVDDSPTYNCDTLHGTTYQIDLSQPNAHDGGSRITQLACNGKPIRPDDIFTIATNSYRASGAGGYPSIPPMDILHRDQARIRDVLIAYLQGTDSYRRPLDPHWSFAAMGSTTAFFDSAAQASQHMPRHVTLAENRADGSTRYRIHL